MKTKRNFLAPNITESMLGAIRTGGGIQKFESSVEELRQCELLYSSINNQALMGTLEKLGVNPKKIEKFSLDSDDSLFVVRVEGLEKPIRDYSSLPALPEPCTLVITRYKVR